MICGYIIVLSDQDGTQQYIGLDRNSGGHLYWTGNISQALVFKTEEDAKKTVTEDFSFNQGSKMNSGNFDNIPLLVHSGLGLSGVKPSGNGVITVCPLEIGAPKFKRKISASLSRNEFSIHE